MRIVFFQVILFLLIGLFVWAGCGNAASSDGSDGDSDGDGDGDSDGDADSDSDTDADGDTDSDGDTDTDSDGDSDTDSDADGDSDEDDGPPSSDDSDFGAFDDSDYTCANQCLNHCASWGGTVMVGTCPGDQRCCDGADVPDSETVPDTEDDTTDTQTGSVADTESEVDTGKDTAVGADTDTTADYYVAVGGDDDNPGTFDEPFATLQKAHDEVEPGQKVLIRGGTYMVEGNGGTGGIEVSKSGTSDDERIRFWAYPGETPVFDFADADITANSTAAGIYVTGSWLHFRGLEICNVPMPGFGANNGIWQVRASNNTYELMKFHDNQGPGLSIAYGDGGNLILNCDSYDNYDVKQGGEDADGFGIHYQTSGTPTIIRGCRAWWNADDGYDLYKQEFPVIIEDSWAMGNGYVNEGTLSVSNGSGFKMGNTFDGVRHTIRNCLAWENKVGFYANHSFGGTDWFNNTSYNNGMNFNMYSDTTLTGDLLHYLRNNVALPASLDNMGNGNSEFNSWDLDVTVSESDFVTTSDDGWDSARQADGSLPDIDFMKLSPDSPLIDAGTDVELPFSGDAPDLGAYEYAAGN